MTRKPHPSRPRKGSALAWPPDRLLRLLLFVQLAAVTLLITINVRDAALLKLPVAWGMASLMAAAAAVFALRAREATLPATAADLPLLLTVVMTLVGFIAAGDRHAALPALLLVLVSATALLSGAHLFHNRGHTDAFLAVLTGVAAAVVGMGLFQYFFDERVGVQFFSGSDLRVASTLGSPSFLGGWIVLVVPVLLADLLERPFRSARALVQTGVLGGLVLLLFMTRTRSSIVALPVGLAVVLLFRGGPRRTLLIAAAGAAAAFAAAAAFVPGVANRLASLADVGGTTTFMRRMPIWEAGWKAFLGSPLFGHGPGQFERVMRDYRSPDYWMSGSEDVIPHAHNELLEIAVDGGVAALAVAGWMLIAAARSARKGSAGAPGWRRGLIAGILGGVAASLVDNLANVSLRQAPVSLTLWMMAGLLFSPALGAVRDGGHLFSVRLPRLSPVLPLLLWAAGIAWYGPGVAGRVKAEGFVLYGVLAAVRGEEARAPEYYAAAAAADPHYLEGVFGAASSHLVAGRPGESLAYAVMLRRTAPNYPKLGMVEAAAYFQVDSLDAALRSIDEELARRSHPESWYIAAKILEARADSGAEHAALENLLRFSIRGGTDLYLRHTAGRLCRLCPDVAAPGHGLPAMRELAGLLPRSAEAAVALRMLEHCAGLPDSVSP